ncbi:MAG TPA: prephenate dehydratase [Solirubrobacteraceae bacterium]|jgi:prephenate dehydratase|nr:prephenate dehydratase [Solirubrobacteraceae bacterium]
MSPQPERGRSRAAFLGPAGTFSEEALLAGAEPAAVEPLPKPTIFETVMALRDGEAELAVVPIENSLEGSINVTLDLLADNAPAIRIVAETRVRVRHSLIAAATVPLGGIRTVISHPAVPGQCTRFLRGELAHAEIRLADSTAEAVRAVVAGGDAETAALGTTLAAGIYGGEVLREGVQDRDDNETRFVWLAGSDRGGGALPLRAGGDERRCSIVFWGAGAEHPGWLVRCLGEFADREINLTKIESRPRRERMGSYMFFADLGAGEEDPAVAAALASLGGMCEEVRVLGSYASTQGG